MQVTLKTLSQMFDSHVDQTDINYDGKCHKCNCMVNLIITKTSSGYGFQGGGLFEPTPGHLIIQCDKCYKIDQES